MPRISKSKPLSLDLTNRLLAYAAAAGVSVATFYSSAEAKVVYTPVHLTIDRDYYFDLNHDGQNDFHIHSYYLSLSGNLEVLPVIPINKIAAAGSGCFFGNSGAAPLPRGTVIGQAQSFRKTATCMASTFSSRVVGPWPGEQEHYLGLEFFVDGQRHFGWARFTVRPFFCVGCMARLEGFAYETIPNKPIVAGDQGNSAEGTEEANRETKGDADENSLSLGALALGAPGLNIWRKVN